MKPNKHYLRVATYNINWGEDEKAIKHPEDNINVVRKLHADIIFLQEITPYWEKCFRTDFKKDYPYQEFHQFPNAGGLGIISKYPFHTKYYLYPLMGWHPGWILDAQTPLGKIQLYNVHLTPPLVDNHSVGFLGIAYFTTRPIREKEIKICYALLNKKLPTIIAGDFNEGPTGRAVKFLKQNTVLDAAQVSGQKFMTWQWEWGPLLLNDRLDYIFYSPDLHLHYFQVVKEGESDHYPLFADFSR